MLMVTRSPWPPRRLWEPTSSSIMAAGLAAFDRALITVDGTGDSEGFATVLRSTEDYGYCTSVAIYFGSSIPLPLLEMYTRGVTFHVSRADSRRLLPEVIDLVASKRLDPLRVPTTLVPWDQAPTAWMEPATKLVLVR